MIINLYYQKKLNNKIMIGKIKDINIYNYKDKDNSLYAFYLYFFIHKDIIYNFYQQDYHVNIKII